MLIRGRGAVVSKADTVESIVKDLKHTSPYSPNHEGIKSPWRVTIAMSDGSSLEFKISDGNREHPSFVWIQFGVEVYQNDTLRKALRIAGVDVWGNLKEHEKPKKAIDSD